jgi:hypothetical protein
MKSVIPQIIDLGADQLFWALFARHLLAARGVIPSPSPQVIDEMLFHLTVATVYSFKLLSVYDVGYFIEVAKTRGARFLRME